MKTLVVYFSLTDNTKNLANKIEKITNADTLRIKAAHPYSKKYLPTFFVCLKEMITNARPAFANKVPDLKKYDLVLVGAPIWGGNFPAIVFSFLDKCDLKNKKIAIFSTSDKIGPENAQKKCKKLYSNAKWLVCFNGNDKKSKDLKKWLKSIKAI